MIFVLDNYDSFTFNLVQFLGELGAQVTVARNDAVTVDDVIALHPAGVVISPGPGVPQDAGISVPLVGALAGRQPILGVCLGHQAIGVAFGGRLRRADRIMHGKTSPIRHLGTDVFDGLPNPLTGMRYHSLLLDPAAVPPELEITAWTADRERGEEIMGLRHVGYPVFGVQFHPESLGTDAGHTMLANFLRFTARVDAAEYGVSRAASAT